MAQARQNIVAVALTVAMGGFLLGFDATVISGVVPFIRDYFGLTGTGGDLKLGWAVSSLGWGAMLGNAAAGVLSDRFGRKKVLIVTALLFIASALSASQATNFVGFVAARIIGGLAVGSAILIAPVYIAEISPAGRRGSLVSLNQLMIVIGISASFFSNWLLVDVHDNWRWMLGVQVVPALLYLTLLCLVPESPRWLLLQGREQDALKSLSRVCGEEFAARQLAEVRASLAEKKIATGFRSLFSARMRTIMLIAFGIAFFQQITGINAIFYYLPTIFGLAGGALSNAFGQAVLVGVVNVGMTLVAIWLIDSLGRRPLLAVGAAGMALSLLTISWAFSQAQFGTGEQFAARAAEKSVPAELVREIEGLALPVFAREGEYVAALEKRLGVERVRAHRAALVASALDMNAQLVLIAIIGFVASFAISLGPVMWVLLSEIFPNESRGAAMSVVGFWNATVSASVTFIFPWELSTLGSAGVFLVYGLFAVAAFVFVLLFVKETKGRTLEQLEDELVRTAQPVPSR